MKTQTKKINNRDVKYFQTYDAVSGCSRYVVHYSWIDEDYNIALEKSRVIGGKKYRVKWLEGGIVITTYNIKDDLAKIIPELKMRVVYL